MAYSSHSYVGDGTDAELAINFTLGFLDRDHVHAYVEGVEVTPITWINDGLIKIGVVAVGDAILIRRQTPATVLAHDYSNGAVITADHLDNSNLQNIMLAHEVLDGYRDAGFEYREDQDLGGNKIINLGAGVNDTDAATMAQLNATIAAVAADKASAEASATAAALSEANAATSESNAAASAASASADASTATTKAAEASASAAAAALSETNASSSESAAAASASGASTSETNAATSASNAATSETNAATSETNAATSASNAATSATNAGTSETNAAASAAEAAADLATFQGQYHGPSATAPTVGVDVGDLYFDTTVNYMKVCSAVSPDVWDEVTSAGATGGGSNRAFYENETNVTDDYTITSGNNAMSAGPITIDTGVTVTVPTGSVWTVV